jgi:hypothetical protein
VLGAFPRHVLDGIRGHRDHGELDGFVDVEDRLPAPDREHRAREALANVPQQRGADGPRPLADSDHRDRRRLEEMPRGGDGADAVALLGDPRAVSARRPRARHRARR